MSKILTKTTRSELLNEPEYIIRIYTLLQGVTNSVAQFLRVVIRLLYDLIPYVCRPFIDDIRIKGPELIFEDTETIPGIR